VQSFEVGIGEYKSNEVLDATGLVLGDVEKDLEQQFADSGDFRVRRLAGDGIKMIKRVGEFRDYFFERHFQSQGTSQGLR